MHLIYRIVVRANGHFLYNRAEYELIDTTACGL